MSLIIEDPEVERLAAEVAAATGESETDAIRAALKERKERLSTLEERVSRFREKMEREVWSKLPAEARGKPMVKEEKEEILGYTLGLGYTDHGSR